MVVPVSFFFVFLMLCFSAVHAWFTEYSILVYFSKSIQKNQLNFSVFQHHGWRTYSSALRYWNQLSCITSKALLIVPEVKIVLLLIRSCPHERDLVVIPLLWSHLKLWPLGVVPQTFDEPDRLISKAVPQTLCSRRMLMSLLSSRK